MLFHLTRKRLPSEQVSQHRAEEIVKVVGFFSQMDA